MEPIHPGRIQVLAALAVVISFWGRPLPAQECVLIATGGLDAITVFDLGAQRVTARIPVREQPINIAVSATGRTAFAANSEDNSVSIIDLEAGTSTGLIPVGILPIDLAVHPDGERLYVSDRNSERVSIVDIAAREVVDTINVGSGPSDIVVHSNGLLAYVANFRSNSVSVLDLQAAQVADTIPVGEQPFSLALSPDEERLYVTNTVSETLTVIATADNSIVKTIGLGGFLTDVAVHPDGTTVYVSRGAPDGDVVVIDAAMNVVRTTIPVETGAELSAIAVSRDASTVFAVEFFLGNLFFIDTIQGRRVGFESIGGAGSAPQGIKVTHVPSGCPLPPIPRLAAEIGAADEEIQVDRPDALPIGGTLMIGAELMTYRSVFFDRLREVTRGVRGTLASPHPAGTQVYLVGLPADANCDGRTSAADITEVIRQLPSGDPGPCGGDIDRDTVVSAADLAAATLALYAR